MKRILLFVTIFVLCSSLRFSTQDYREYTIDEFYKKIELDDGTLDEDGHAIDFIYARTEIDAGKYEIVITDARGNLYNIKGTNLYLKFRGYYGYAGYGNAGILVVNKGYTPSKFYKEE